MTTDYQAFIANKGQSNTKSGFKPLWLPDFLFDFQGGLLEWSIETGRSAILADCGLGKTPMELVYAQNVVQHTNKKVLILTFCAVAGQMVREAEKFGIKVTRSFDGTAYPGITITNYEKLHLFNRNDFITVICDESSILKSFNGKRKTEVTAFMRKMPYRLLATATAAPNDYIELGTSSEALGYLGHMDMLNKFFKNDQNNSATGRIRGEQVKWRFKGHAEQPFWRWVCGWARAMRKPSDMGYDDAALILPSLTENEHIVEARTQAEGQLFASPAHGLFEEREEMRRTIPERCEKAAALVRDTGEPYAIWCQLNDEGDLLEKLCPDAVQISGSDSDEKKEEKFLSFLSGETRGLITKTKIGAWGLNMQHCNHTVYFPSHSFEQYYQAIRRFWRFGQQRPVTVDIVTTEGGAGIVKNMRRKQQKADVMFDNLMVEMNNAIYINRSTEFAKSIILPEWLKGE